MKYFQTTCGLLVKYFDLKDFYVITNNVKLKDKRISSEDFNKLQKIQIKNQKFSKLMNDYYRTVKESWSYQHKNYRNLANFDPTVDYNMPRHNIDTLPYKDKLIMVYHWGKVYFYLSNHNSNGRGQLICPKTLKIVRWVRLQNCAPIFDEDLKKII
jgi:hypothetical protein